MADPASSDPDDDIGESCIDDKANRFVLICMPYLDYKLHFDKTLLL